MPSICSHLPRTSIAGLTMQSRSYVWLLGLTEGAELAGGALELRRRFVYGASIGCLQ